MTMLQEHDGIDATRTLIVNFNVFGATSLDLMVHTFTKTAVWTEYRHVKQDVLLKHSRIGRDRDRIAGVLPRCSHARDEFREPRRHPNQTTR